MNDQEPKEEIVLDEDISVALESDESKIILEQGIKMRFDSIAICRNFAKTMVSISFTAIPVYLGLLKLVLHKELTTNIGTAIIIILPPVIYLIDTIIFIFAYLPKKFNVYDRLPDNTEEERNRVLRRRLLLIHIGTSIFFIATIVAILIITFY